MNIGVIAAVLAVLLLIGVYLSWTAGRLDRLHNRTAAAWASLDAQLVRRAAAALELAHESAQRGLLDEPPADALAAAAQHSLDAGAGPEGPTPERVAAENALGRELRAVLDGPAGDLLCGDVALAPLLAVLDAAMTKVVLARRFHATAVEDTSARRQSRVARWLRLAGSAPMPAYFDIDDTPARLPISPAARPH